MKKSKFTDSHYTSPSSSNMKMAYRLLNWPGSTVSAPH